MPLSNLDIIRSRIQDYAKAEDIFDYGDGLKTRFNLPHKNIMSATALVVVGGTAYSATAATFNVSGYVTFSSIIPLNTAVNFQYVQSTFSDDEIGYFTASGGGSVAGAALLAIRALRFDGLKRARWMASNGTQFDSTNAITELGRIESALKAELEEDAALAGGSVIGWSEGQQDFL